MLLVRNWENSRVSRKPEAEEVIRGSARSRVCPSNGQLISHLYSSGLVFLLPNVFWEDGFRHWVELCPVRVRRRPNRPFRGAQVLPTVSAVAQTSLSSVYQVVTRTRS